MNQAWKLEQFGRWFWAVVLLATAGYAELPNMPPQELVRKTVDHEVASSQNSSVRHMFVSHKQTAHGSQTKLYVETDQAMAGLAVANDGRPLTDEQRRAEFDRLEHLASDPQELAKKHAREKEDADRAQRIVRAMPDAFLFDYDGTTVGQPGIGKPGDELIRLKFHPNPRYEPPTRVEEVLVGMEGTLLVDARQYRIAQIDGTLTKEVSFGWGILGHLDKGGRFLVEQEDLGDGSWDASHMILRFTGKILLFKHLDIQSEEVFRDYRRVSNALTFAQGVDLLKKELASVAANSSASQTPGVSESASTTKH